MMYEFLSQLETTVIKLEQVNSLFNCMFRSYFEYAQPNKEDLSANYKDITGVINAIQDITDEQRKIISQTTNSLYDIRKEMKQIAERNMVLLKGQF